MAQNFESFEVVLRGPKAYDAANAFMQSLRMHQFNDGGSWAAYDDRGEHWLQCAICQPANNPVNNHIQGRIVAKHYSDDSAPRGFAYTVLRLDNCTRAIMNKAQELIA